MKPLFDDYDDSYDDVMKQSIGFMGRKHDYYTQAKVDCLLDNFHTLFGSTKHLRVLDVGCGVGSTDRLLFPEIENLTGVDVSSASIERARLENPQYEYESYDGRTLPFNNESFDAAFLICVLHHVLPEEREALMREVRRVLRPGGAVFIFEHNPFHPLTRLVVNRCEFDRDAQLLTRQESCALVEQSGYSPLDTQYILYLPFKVGFLKKLTFLRRWMPFGTQYFTSGKRGSS